MQGPVRLRQRRFKGIEYTHIFPPRDKKLEITTKYTTILASGPNGKVGWEYIQDVVPRKDNTLVAVNYAVAFSWIFNIPYIWPEYWVVTDRKAIRQVVPPDTTAWFPSTLDRYIKEGGKPCFNLGVIEDVWFNLKHHGPFLMFRSKRLMTKHTDIIPHVDVIRPGGSVTCSALQIWFHFSTHPERTLLICGADMSGDDYARGKNTLKQHGKVWNSVTCLGTMIKFCTDRKLQVYTVSDTKLVDAGYIKFPPNYKQWKEQLKSGESNKSKSSA